MEFVTKYKVVGYNDSHRKISQVILPKQPDETMLKSIVSQYPINIAYFEILEINQVIENKTNKYNFTNDELSILKNIDKKWKYIARDYNNNLYLYTTKPSKLISGWGKSDPMGISIYNNIFKSIEWEDEEPVKIDDYVDRS